MANSHGRAIIPEDRAALLRALAAHGPHQFEALRTAALVQLAWLSGLRISECIALDVPQLIEWQGAVVRVRSAGYLRVDQAKGSKGRRPDGQWTSAGQFVVPAPAARALRAYVREGTTRGWLGRDAGPLFIAHRRNGATSLGHGRLSRKGAWKAWQQLQRRAGLRRPFYRFHDLRHDAITRFATACHGHAFKVARFARLDLRTAARYVQLGSWEAIAEIAAVAARSAG